MAVLLSIKPRFCELIASGIKTIELRKSKPIIDTPFKCYIYCCKPKKILRYVWTKEDYKGYLDEEIYNKIPDNQKTFCKIPDGSSPFCSRTYSGKVIGEFVCDNISVYPYFDNSGYSVSYRMIQKMCLNLSEFEDYGNCKKLYGWHISDIIIYDNPKELSDLGMKRPPQSWCYVMDKE